MKLIYIVILILLYSRLFPTNADKEIVKLKSKTVSKYTISKEKADLFIDRDNNINIPSYFTYYRSMKIDDETWNLTRSGIFIEDNNGKIYKWLNQDNGLSDTASDVEIDGYDSNILWLTSRYGLSCYNKTTKTAYNITNKYFSKYMGDPHSLKVFKDNLFYYSEKGVFKINKNDFQITPVLTNYVMDGNGRTDILHITFLMMGNDAIWVQCKESNSLIRIDYSSLGTNIFKLDSLPFNTKSYLYEFYLTNGFFYESNKYYIYDISNNQFQPLSTNITIEKYKPVSFYQSEISFHSNITADSFPRIRIDKSILDDSGIFWSLKPIMKKNNYYEVSHYNLIRFDLSKWKIKEFSIPFEISFDENNRDLALIKLLSYKKYLILGNLVYDIKNGLWIKLPFDFIKKPVMEIGAIGNKIYYMQGRYAEGSEESYLVNYRTITLNLEKFNYKVDSAIPDLNNNENYIKIANIRDLNPFNDDRPEFKSFFSAHKYFKNYFKDFEMFKNNLGNPILIGTNHNQVWFTTDQEYFLKIISLEDNM